MQITFAISKTKTVSLHDDVEIGRSFWLSAIFRRHNTRTRGGTEHPTKRPKATSTERALVVFFASGMRQCGLLIYRTHSRSIWVYD